MQAAYPQSVRYMQKWYCNLLFLEKQGSRLQSLLQWSKPPLSAPELSVLVLLAALESLVPGLSAAPGWMVPGSSAAPGWTVPGLSAAPDWMAPDLLGSVHRKKDLLSW